jgi:glutaredoxin
MLKAFLDENKVSYVEVDIEKDDKAREEMVRKTGNLSIPVTDIDGEIIIGFDKAAFKKILNLK